MDTTTTEQQPAPAPIQTETTITLAKPVNVGSVQFAELKLTEPTLGQLRKAEALPGVLDQLAMLVHLTANVPPLAVDQLTQRDAQRCADFFAQFSSSAPSRSN
jgi:hypothetical protein